VHAHLRTGNFTAASKEVAADGNDNGNFRSLYPFAVQPNGDSVNLSCMPGFGFGRGLPVARLAARYFGGDLDLVSMEGHGTDVYVHLARADTCLENFPASPEVADSIDRNYWIIPPPAKELEI
jgi:hypothetical protein